MAVVGVRVLRVRAPAQVQGQVPVQNPVQVPALAQVGLPLQEVLLRVPLLVLLLLQAQASSIPTLRNPNGSPRTPTL